MLESDATTAYLEEQLNLFIEENDRPLGTLLELTIMQIMFLQIVGVTCTGRLTDHEISRIRLHMMKTLEIAAKMANIEDDDIDRVVSKSLELVDCASAMNDPTRTNLH